MQPRMLGKTNQNQRKQCSLRTERSFWSTEPDKTRQKFEHALVMTSIRRRVGVYVGFFKGLRDD